MLKNFLLICFAILLMASFSQITIAQTSNNLLNGGQIDYSFRLSRIYPPEESSYPRLIIQPDGKLLVVGKFSSDTQNVSSRKLYRFLPNGSYDTEFTPYYPISNIRIEKIVLQPDGKIIYLYTFNDDENYTTLNVIRLNADGTRDTSFNFVPYYRTVSSFFGVLPLPDGKILISATFVERGEFPTSRSILKINSDGSLDQQFIDNFSSGYAAKFHLQADGKILAQSNILRRLNADGTQDATFPVYSNVRDFQILSDDKIIFSTTNNELIRLFPNGGIDSSFQANPDLTNFQFGVKSNGEIILSVYGCIIFPNCRTSFEQLNADGSFKRRFESKFARGNMTISPNNQVYIQGEMLFGNTKFGLVKIKTEYTPTRRKAFDFDGDGKSDISVYRPSDGTWYIYYSLTNSFNAVRFGIAEDKPVPADYDGDTIGDIAVYRPSSGIWYIWRSSDGQVSIINFGLSEDIPTQYDYDGDGKDDISLYRPSSGVWYRLNSSDGSFFSKEFGGIAGDRPVSGDYDGDGIADLAYWRTSTGRWNYLSSLNGVIREGTYNFYETDVATPADYDGDSKIDYSLFKNHNGGWYGIRSSGSGFYVPWGAPGDIPVPADYDGDGKDDFAIWRPATGEWWIIQSSNGYFYSFRFGTAGDIPIPSTFTR